MITKRMPPQKWKTSKLQYKMMCMIQIYKCSHTEYALMKEKHYKAIRKYS